MNLSLEERLLVPALLAAIVAALSFGFMFTVGGATRRMRVASLCVLLFITGTMYCMFWREQLTSISGWNHAWIAGSVLVAIGSICLWRSLAPKSSADHEECGRG